MNLESSQDQTPSRLVERIGQGDRIAEHALVIQFRPRILCFLEVRTGNPDLAEDLLQEVLMSVICALRRGHVRDAENLAAYIHGTARNLLNDHFRKQGREKTDALDPAMDIPQPPPDFVGMEQRKELERAIRELPLDDRRILMLTLVDGCKPAEIASTLSLSSDVVRQRKSRALKKLIERLNPASQSSPGTPHVGGQGS